MPPTAPPIIPPGGENPKLVTMLNLEAFLADSDVIKDLQIEYPDLFNRIKLCVDSYRSSHSRSICDNVETLFKDFLKTDAYKAWMSRQGLGE